MNNTMVMLTDGTRKLYIEEQGLLSFLAEEAGEELTPNEIQDYFHNTSEEELTDLFEIGVRNYDIPGYMVLGYYIDANVPDGTIPASAIFVAIDEGQPGILTYYSPIGQHTEGDREYIEACTPITKEEYLSISKNIYTPAEYL